MRTVTVTWRAFGGRDYGLFYEGDKTATFEIDSDLPDLALCEKVYRDTNLYEGEVWDLLEPVLPEGRSHTALSTVFGRGDYVTVDRRTYQVMDMGFREVQ